MPLQSSISGIRGTIGDSLTPRVIADYVSAFASITGKGKILLGRDSRPSGNMIVSIVKGVLNFAGNDVIDIGIVPTPVVLYGVLNGDFAGGIVITASHNPIQWNALKLVNKNGKFFSPAQFGELTRLYGKKEFSYSLYDKIGSNSSNDNIPDAHADAIINFIDQALVKKAKFSVALDSVNGAGGPHTVKILKGLSCNVISINEEQTGIFSHPPEPKPENLTELSNLIKASRVDAGFAIDPDGDRLVVSDEKGNILSEELTLALCVRHYLASHKKTDVVINLSTSRIIEDIADSFGCRVFRVPTGEINVTEKMEEIDSKIGGEGNGGIILRKINKCRDASVGIALILEMLAKENKKLSEIVELLPKYILVKDKISSERIDYSKILENIMIEFKDQNIDSSDGIRVDFDDKWVLFRKSNTEPIIRIFAEAQTEKAARELIEKIKLICGNC